MLLQLGSSIRWNILISLQKRLDVPAEMALQIFVVRCFVLLQCAQNAIFENRLTGAVFASENGTERHVQNLPRIIVIKEAEKTLQRTRLRGRNLIEPGGDMVRCLVHLVAAAREVENLAKQLRFSRRDGSQRFEIARAGSFHVDAPELQRANRQIDAEFVAARMNADFVRAERVGDFNMLDILFLE